MTRTAAFVTVLAVELLAAAAALLIATRTWQVVRTPRPKPLADDVLALSGRTVDSACTALALVALAGVVAVLATRGVVRRVVGGVVACTGAALVWQSLVASAALSQARALALVHAEHRTVTIDPGVQPQVTAHSLWASLSVLCGVLVAIAGVLVALYGSRWPAMSARYESRTRPADAPPGDSPRAAATLWNALDRGDDPTITALTDADRPVPGSTQGE